MRDLVFFDTETTSAEPDARLIQYAIIWDDHGMSRYCKPPVPISIAAMSIHHVTEKMAADFPPFQPDGADKPLIDLAKETRIFVAHNAKFDVQVMANEGVEIKDYICTLKVARWLYPEMPQHKLQYLRYALGVEVELDGQAHDAYYDAYVLAEVFNRIFDDAKKRIDEEYDEDCTEEGVIEKMLEVTRQPSILHTVTFGKHKGSLWSELVKNQPDYCAWLLGQNGVSEEIAATINHYRKV